jgi:hypothetical protein
MEVNETVSIFQNLAYPVAVSVILFLCAIWFGRKMLEEMRTKEKNYATLFTQYVDFLQKSNSALSKALTDNADALLKFSRVLEIFEHKLNGNAQPN